MTKISLKESGIVSVADELLEEILALDIFFKKWAIEKILSAII